MRNDSQRRLVQSMLDLADVRIGGDRPFDIEVNDPRLYSAVLGGGTLGLGEAYMNGWWDSPDVESFIAWGIRIEHREGSVRSPLFLQLSPASRPSRIISALSSFPRLSHAHLDRTTWKVLFPC